MSEKTIVQDILGFWSVVAYTVIAVSVPTAVVVTAVVAFIAALTPEPPPLCFDVVRAVSIFETCPDAAHTAAIQGDYVVCSCPR